MPHQTKKAIKLLDERITKAYSKSCSGIQISIWDMGKVMETGKTFITANPNATDEQLQFSLREFVETIRQN